MSADVLSPNGARSSASTVMTTFFLQFLRILIISNTAYIFADQILFKTADEIPRDLAALSELVVFNWLSWWRHQMETFSAILALCAGIHWSPVNSPHKGQWRGALMFSLICWINDWVNNDEAGDLRCHRAHYDVSVMWCHLPDFHVKRPQQKCHFYECFVTAWLHRKLSFF